MCRDHARGERNDPDAHQRQYKRKWISRAETVKKAAQRAGKKKRKRQSQPQSRKADKHALANYHPENLLSIRTERHPNPDFGGTPADPVRECSVKSDSDQQSRQQ